MLPLRTRVDLGAMAMSLTIRLFNFISRKLDGGVLPHCRDAVGVFYSPSKLGHQTNEPKNKALHLINNIDRFFVSRREGTRGLTSIEDCIAATIQELEKYTKDRKERLITVVNNCNVNISWLVGWLFCFTVYQPFLSHLTPNKISNNSV